MRRHLRLDGSINVAPVLTDPRFSTPLSGYYWQVEDLATGALTRSRSLWDAALVLPAEASGGGKQVHEINGPGGALLIAVQRTIADPSGRSFRAAVAEDHQTVAVSVNEYMQQLAPAILLLALVLLAAIFVQITVGPCSAGEITRRGPGCPRPAGGTARRGGAERSAAAR